MINYAAILKRRNQADSFVRELGVVITKLEEGYSEGEMKIENRFKNQIDSVHGGVFFSLADTLAGAASSSYGYKTCTANASFYYLKAGLNIEYLKACAKVIKHGRRLNIVEVKIFDQAEDLLCIGTFTFTNLNEKLAYAWLN